MTPYGKTVTPITDIASYFKKNETDFSLEFIGKSLEVRIPKRFSTYGALTVEDGSVTAPGIADLIFDETYQAGLNILASVTIAFSDLTYMTYQGTDYLVLHLTHGDKFLTSYRVLQNPQIVYILWTEWVTKGGVAYWMNYPSLLKMFEHARELTGAGIGVSRSVFEGIIAHLARDPDNLSVQYRLTDMTKPVKLVALSSVSSAPTSTIARLNGSYFRDEGLTSALRNEVDQQQPFENLLRGLSSGVDENDNAAAL